MSLFGDIQNERQSYRDSQVVNGHNGLMANWFRGYNYGENVSEFSDDNPYNAVNMLNRYGTKLPDGTIDATAISDYFGDSRLGLDRFMQMQNSALAWEEAERQYQRDLEYNSESAKVQRMRDAGLNPDLNGISDSSSSVGAMPDMSSGLSPVAPRQSSMDGFGQLMNTIVGLYTTANNIKAQSLEMESKELDNLSKANDLLNLTDDDVKSILGDFDISKYYQLLDQVVSNGGEPSEVLHGKDLDDYYDMVDEYNSILNSFGDTVEARISSLPSKVQKSFRKGFWFSRNDSTSSRFRSVYYDKLSSMFRKRYDLYSTDTSDEDSFVDFMLKLVENFNIAEGNEAQYNSDYWREYGDEGSNDAASDITARRAKDKQNNAVYNNTFDDSSNEAWSSVMKSLAPDIKKGDKWSIFCAIALSWLRSNGTSAIGSLIRSRGTKSRPSKGSK